MDRRKSLKSIVLGSVAGGLVLNGCNPAEAPKEELAATAPEDIKWMTAEENKIMAELQAEQFFNEHELETLTVLCDLILPGTGGYKSASDAEVVPFIEFMAKDMPQLQGDLRGGLMWLDHKSNTDFGLEFKSASAEQQKTLLDTIAYYDSQEPQHERPFGVNFFATVRNLTMTGFYTSKIGIEELGYKGNMPNVWNGVPDEVLAQHGVSYDPEWLAKCVDQSQRNVVAQWDGNGRLIT